MLFSLSFNFGSRPAKVWKRNLRSVDGGFCFCFRSWDDKQARRTKHISSHRNRLHPDCCWFSSFTTLRKMFVAALKRNTRSTKHKTWMWSRWRGRWEEEEETEKSRQRNSEKSIAICSATGLEMSLMNNEAGLIDELHWRKVSLAIVSSFDVTCSGLEAVT